MFIKDLSKSPSEWWSCTTVYLLTKSLREWKDANIIEKW